MIAALFPGQGIPARHVLDALDDTSGEITISAGLRKRVDVCARRPGAPLPTDVAQPAIFLAGVQSWERARSGGFSPDLVAGHSLGEYTALACAGAISYEDGLRAVTVRGAAMQAAGRNLTGGMAAVIGLGLADVEMLAEASGVIVANDNAPGQIVVSGEQSGLEALAAGVRGRGGRSVLLEVSGPWHTQAVAPARKPLRAVLESIEIRVPEIPVVSNVTARPYRAPGEIRALLLEQLTGRVRFRESLEWLGAQGVREVRDLGPGRVVEGLAHKTLRQATTPAGTAHV